MAVLGCLLLQKMQESKSKHTAEYINTRARGKTRRGRCLPTLSWAKSDHASHHSYANDNCLAVCVASCRVAQDAHDTQSVIYNKIWGLSKQFCSRFNLLNCFHCLVQIEQSLCNQMFALPIIKAVTYVWTCPHRSAPHIHTHTVSAQLLTALC